MLSRTQMTSVYRHKPHHNDRRHRLEKDDFFTGSHRSKYACNSHTAQEKVRQFSREYKRYFEVCPSQEFE